MTTVRRIGLFAVLLLSISGCDKTTTSRELAVVNGKPLTDAFLKGVVGVQAKIRQFSGKGVSEKEFTAWANKEAERVFPQLVMAEILAAGLEKEGIRAGTNEIHTVLMKYNRLLRRSARTPDELFREFGDLADDFRCQFERSCIFEASNVHFGKQEVSEEEVADYLDDKRILTEMAAALDKKGRENATNAWQRLNNGDDWQVVAKECSEDKLVSPENEDFKDEWATVGQDGMGYPELAIALRTLHKGEYSKPLDVDEGLIIVKVLEELPEKRCTLARMLFRMAEPVEIPTREAAREELRVTKAAKAQEAFYENLKSSAAVLYPCGTNLVFNVFGE